MRPGEPVLTEAQMARAARLLIASLAVFGIVGIAVVHFASPGHRPADYQRTVLLWLAIGALIAAFLIPLRPQVVRADRMPIALLVSTAGAAAACWFAGPVIDPYVAMSFLWIGMFAHLFLTRRNALAFDGLLALIYAGFVTFQSGSRGPVTRWILVIGAVTVAGQLVGGLSDRIHELLASERALRTEVEDAGRRLEVANRQRREFLAGMSHELRTPLNAIIGFSDVLAEGFFGALNAAQMDWVDTIRRAGGRLLELVGEVLDLDSVQDDPSDQDVAAPRLGDRETLIRADPRGALAFFLLAPPAMATLPSWPAGFHFGPLIAIIAGGVALDMAILVGPWLPSRARPALHITVVTLVAFGAAMEAGAVVSPFVTLFFMWMATAASIRLGRVGLVLQLGLIAVCEAIVVTVQRGNVAPFYRWEITVGTACVTALLIRLVVQRLFDAADREARMLAIAEHAQAELEAANRHKVEFLSHVRGDLRSPVDEVTAAAAALLADELSPKQREYVRDIASAGNQLWTLITDIVDLATLESGGMAVEATDTAVVDLVQDALADYLAPAEAAGVRVGVVIEPPDARAWTDRDKVRRALAGLVSNAVKFSPRGGGVQVRVRVDDRQMVIDVTDNGPGIATADLDRIFEGFQQGGSAMAAPGVGVGLTLARRFVELQGGRLDVSSEPGVGSTFVITVPIERPASALQEAPVA